MVFPISRFLRIFRMARWEDDKISATDIETDGQTDTREAFNAVRGDLCGRAEPPSHSLLLWVSS